MLRVISAPPGTGKTLLMVQQIYEYLNKGYQVYANITGLKIAGVLPAPYDWRDLPNDSVVFYDEAHEHPAFAKQHGLVQQESETLKDYKKRVADCLDIGNSLSVHRHFGFHIIFATQDPSEQLDSRLFGFFNEHIHLHRAFNASLATTYFWRKVQRNPDAKSTQKLCEVKGTFRYPKHLYNFYSSSSGEHNHKFKIPYKYLAFALIPIILFGKGYANAQETGLFGMFGSKQEVAQIETMQENTAQTTQNNNPTISTTHQPEQVTPQQAEAKRIAFVSKSDTYCRAFDGNGNLMTDIQMTECIYYSDNPMALQAQPKELKQQSLQAANYQSNNSFDSAGELPPENRFISATEVQTF